MKPLSPAAAEQFARSHGLPLRVYDVERKRLVRTLILCIVAITAGLVMILRHIWVW